MGVITKISFRNIKRRKIRYILTTLSLIIGVALFGGVMIASDSFNKIFLDSIDQQMGTADILIRSNATESGWFDPTYIEGNLTRINHVEQIAFRVSGFSVFVSGVDNGTQIDDSTSTNVYGIDPYSNDESKLGGTPYKLDIISELENTNSIEEMLKYIDNETGNRVIVATESLKIKLGKNVHAGDIVRILPREANSTYDVDDTGTWDQYTIVAVVRDYGEAQFYNPYESNEAFSLSQLGPLLFSSISSAHKLVDGNENHTGEYNLGVIGVDDIYNTNKAANNIEKKLIELDDGLDWKVNDLKTDNLEDVNTTMTTIRTMFLVFGLIALILSIVLITNIFNIIRKEQEYETGMFQAIGASKIETFKMFLTQGLIMGLMGSIIGTICSYFISYLIFSITMNSISTIQAAGSYSFFDMDFEIVLLPTTLIMVFSVGFISCLLSSIYPSYKASRKPIIECLNPIEEKSKREKIKFKKPLIYASIGIFLIIGGSWLLFSSASQTLDFASSTNGGFAGDQAAIAMSAPTFVLIGVIILTSLIIRPISKAFVKLFSPVLKQTQLLTKKNILRHRKRTVLTFCMIALTTSYLVGMSVMLDSMRAGVDTTIDDLMGCDARVFAFGAPRSIEEEILTLDNIDDVFGVRYQNAMVRIDGKWIGHSELDNEFNESININIIDTDKVLEHTPDINIISPKSLSVSSMLGLLKSGNNILISSDFASKYNVKAGELLEVNFTLGLTYPTIVDFLEQDDSDAQEDVVTVQMNVVAIIEKIQGFFTGSAAFITSMMGLGTSYGMFISWETYYTLAIQNLPGGGTDIVFRQEPKTGDDEFIDPYMANWVDFSQIQPILESTDGIEYYTTRMDYNTAISTTPFNPLLTNFTSVVGIHTNSTGNLKSDSYFGNHTIIDKDISYSGTTLEELLDTNENVTVVDQTFVDDQNRKGPFGLGSEVSIFPQDIVEYTLLAGGYNTEFINESGFCPDGPLDSMNLTVSDNINKTLMSDNGLLIFNINFFMNETIGDFFLPARLSQAISLGIESRVNDSIDSLEIFALNVYTNEFDKLGDINNNNELNYTLYFNLSTSYIPMPTGMKAPKLELRIVGNSSTISDYSLDIDNLYLNITKSKYDLFQISEWPKFKVIGIINSPKLYNTERYVWENGIEAGFNPGENSVYINYEKARNIVYPIYKGNNIMNDSVSSILVKCDNPLNISSIGITLEEDLTTSVGGSWSIVDIKSLSLQLRISVFDIHLFIRGGNDEEVLESVQQYIQDQGYIVLFGFTRSFAEITFRTIIDLIMFITYGMLILAIVIALIGLMLHCLLTTMSRRREIGMLRSIGLNKSGVIRSISGETLIIALVGVIIGIFAGILQGSLMVFATPTGGFITVTYVIPWLTIIILVSITVIAAILSSIFPARWAANINIIDAVRTR